MRRVCVIDFGQPCDTHGDKPLLLRSADKGALSIRPPECFMCKGGALALHGAPVDVWTIGVNYVMMIAGCRPFL